jgi:hypothetical protein
MPGKSDTAMDHSRNQAPGRPWTVAGVSLTAAVSLVLMFVPLISTASSDGGSDRQSLFENEGWMAAAGLAIPVLISAAPLLVPHRHRGLATIAAAALLAIGVLVSIASVGLFYVPSAALLVVAAVRTQRQR